MLQRQTRFESRCEKKECHFFKLFKCMQWLQVSRLQRPLLNFAPRGKLWPQGWSCPPGVNFVSWDWSYPLGVKFSVCPSILLNSRECSPLGVNIPPKGQISPLGAKFTPRCECHPWGPEVKLRMALRVGEMAKQVIKIRTSFRSRYVLLLAKTFPRLG
jgi:hypothetical protein